jgi:hypothetical protein
MTGFLDIALGFPTALFSFALIVVIAYWILTLLSGFGHHEHTGDHDLDGLGLGGVPVTVAVSLLITFGWFLSYTGSALFSAGFITVIVAVAGAWGLTRLAALPLRRMFPTAVEPSRTQFVGMTCVIRTGQVTDTFGQAEVRSPDGSSAVLQVRGDEQALVAGATALIFDYDAVGEFFRVMPFEEPADPRR